MNSYEINEETIAILPSKEGKTKIIENDEEFFVEESPMKIIENSCNFFGSSYNGRFIGTKKLTGITHKAPIIIEESSEIIFFPTTSPRLNECIWIAHKQIKNYFKDRYLTKILFKNGKEISIDMSYGSLNNQILRSARLESVLISRKKRK